MEHTHHQTDMGSEPPMEPSQMNPDLQAYEGLDGELGPGQYYHEPSGDAHSLDDLKDGPNPNSKPFYPYSTLIRYAIKGSPNQRLLLEDIYFALASRFPYFRNAPPGWKNSIRHNLSLNPCFEKIPRPLTDRGKGHYWTVNDSIDPRTGVHRVRKKKSKGTKSTAATAAAPYPAPTYDTTAPPSEVPTAGPSTQATYPYALGYPEITQYDQSGYPIMPPISGGPQQQQQMQMHADMHHAAEQQHQQQHQQPMPELPTVNDQGMPMWKNIWHNELSKLWLITMHQDRAYATAQAQVQAQANGEAGEGVEAVDESVLQAHESWYQLMAENLKRAFQQPTNPQDVQDNQEDGDDEDGQNQANGMEDHSQYV
ncbi:fork head domain protein [Rhizoctonia solani AG-3 Rhs1AP]|uniref:Fork head domain protein n=2 Tax=Rhizoctonia solani AG-3 TaxID=1086053 RepID=A0A074STN1_9AGAM|nr:fork head domain protein [Rhizoctonia solani AG-3 Rhs1AP]KEP53262.1 fork head domain protein [Rhizoctonia solani 123E]